MRPAKWCLLLGLGFLLVLTSRTLARPVQLAWDYQAPGLPQHTGFLLRGCQREGESCVMRDAQRLGPQQRQATVQVPGRKVRCFIVLTLRETLRSLPSNTLCIQG